MTHRLQRVKELIRRELGPILEKNFSFSGSFITINDIELTPDLKHAFVYLGVLGKGDSHETIIQKLTAARPLIQRQLYKRVVLKNSPTLSFRPDHSVERGVRLVNIIENLPPPAEDTTEDSSADSTDDIHA
jgi:ribosome-binding factor A